MENDSILLIIQYEDTTNAVLKISFTHAGKSTMNVRMTSNSLGTDVFNQVYAIGNLLVEVIPVALVYDVDKSAGRSNVSVFVWGS